MSFPRYPAYKDSGVEWLGEVPEHWQEKPLKTITSINDEVLPESLSPDYEIEYVDIGSVSLANGIEKTEAIPFGDAPSRARRIPRDGDVLVSTVRTYLKAIAPVVNPPLNLVASTGFAIVRPGHELEPGFLKYALQEEHFIQQVISRSTGVSYPAINASDVAKISLNLPGPSEQLAIATFLDRETTKIDALIAEQQRLIELLQEKRQAVISHAVTKGLNPDAPMKDSGVEWLGEVPEHWVVGKLSYYAVVSTGATPDRQKPDYWGGDIPWIKTGEVRYEDIQQAEECITELALKETSCDLLQPGTLLMALYGQGVTRGRVGLLAIPAACNQACAAIKPFSVLSARFLELYFVNAYTHIRSLGNETTQQNLNLDYVRGLEVLLPPQEEQNLIWRSCGERIKGIDSLLGCSFDAIALLQERRSALISAAVTGQIDVRGLVPEASAA